MLNWPLGPRSSDGIWGKYWYKNVESSTKFNPYIPKKINLPKKYQSIYNECKKNYDEIYKYKMNVNCFDL